MSSLSMQFGKWFARAFVVVGAILIAPVAGAADEEFRIESRQGSVESVDYPANRMVVGGVAYDVAPDASVELGGSYGAFTMITPGMNLEILVRRYIDSGHGEVIDVKELEPGTVPVQY